LGKLPESTLHKDDALDAVPTVAGWVKKPGWLREKVGS
jgi:hypothetical protein